jgi:hypothetical protein
VSPQAVELGNCEGFSGKKFSRAFDRFYNSQEISRACLQEES